MSSAGINVDGAYLVGDLVADFLECCGIDTAFGIVSVHNIPILDAIKRRNAIRFVMARGEMGGGHMADGYARVIGGLSALITSTGPGAANAVPALAEARFAGSPVLHITGQTATRFADRGMGTVHDVPDQLGMLVQSAKPRTGSARRRRRSAFLPKRRSRRYLRPAGRSRSRFRSTSSACR